MMFRCNGNIQSADIKDVEQYIISFIREVGNMFNGSENKWSHFNCYVVEKRVSDSC